MKLLGRMDVDCRQLSDGDLLRAFIRQELILYRGALKQYRQALSNWNLYKHNAPTPQPKAPLISQTLNQAIDELLRCEKTSLPGLTFQLIMLSLDVEDRETFQDNSPLFPFSIYSARFLN